MPVVGPPDMSPPAPRPGSKQANNNNNNSSNNSKNSNNSNNSNNSRNKNKKKKTSVLYTSNLKHMSQFNGLI